MPEKSSYGDSIKKLEMLESKFPYVQYPAAASVALGEKKRKVATAH